MLNEHGFEYGKMVGSAVRSDTELRLSCVCIDFDMLWARLHNIFGCAARGDAIELDSIVLEFE